MPNSPNLTLPLAQPITLVRGQLMDAATLIGDLDPIWQARLVWNRAAETILIATAIAVAAKGGASALAVHCPGDTTELTQFIL